MKKSERKAEKRKKKSAAQNAGSQNKAQDSSAGKTFRAILLTIFLVFITLLFLAVEFTPIPQVGTYPGVEEQNHLMATLLRTTVQLQRAKSNQQEYFTVKLSPEELNSLLVTALMVFKAKNAENEDAPMLYGQWQDGKLHTEISYMRAGVYFTIRCHAQIELDNRNLYVGISESTLGSLPLPSSLIEKYTNEAIANLSEKPEMQVFFDMIRSFSFDSDGNALVEISSQRAPELLYSLF